MGPAWKGRHTPTGRRLPLAEAETAFFHRSHAWAVRWGLEAGTADTGMKLAVWPDVAADHEAIRHVNRLALRRHDEARLVDALRAGGCLRASHVAEQGGQVVGHILFGDLPIITEAGTVPALSLPPMAVLHGWCNTGIKTGHRLSTRGSPVGEAP